MLDSSMIVGVTALPFFVFDRLGGGARMSGAVMAVHALAYAACSLTSSGFVSRARNGLVWAMVGIGLMAFVFPVAVLVRNPYVYLLISTPGYAGLALAWPALWSWLGGEPDLKVRTRRMSHYNLAWSTGLAVGPLFAGPLYLLDYRLPFLALTCLASTAGVLVATLPHEKAHYDPPTPEAADKSAANVTKSNAHLYATWLACALSIALLGASRSVFPKQVENLAEAGTLVVGLGASIDWAFVRKPEVAFSYLAFVMNASRVLVFVAMGMTKRWQHSFGVLVVCQCGAMAAFWLLGVTHSYVLMLACFALIGLSSGVVFFASAFYSLADPAKKHRRAAINESTVGIGNFSGAMGCGLLAGAYGVTTPFRWMPVVLIAGLCVQFYLLRRGRTSAA